MLSWERLDVCQNNSSVQRTFGSTDFTCILIVPLYFLLRPDCLSSWKEANHSHSDHAGANQPKNTFVEILYAFLKFLLCFIKYLFPSGPDGIVTYVYFFGNNDTRLSPSQLECTITGFPLPIYKHFKTENNIYTFSFILFFFVKWHLSFVDYYHRTMHMVGGQMLAFLLCYLFQKICNFPTI